MSETTLSERPVASTEGPGPPPGVGARVVTALVVGIPFLAVLFGVVFLWGERIELRDVVLATVFYFAVGHGITVGYHRLLAHRAFVAKRPLKLALVALGSMAYEGGPISWVATHRRHHAFADKAGDPHAPGGHGAGAFGQLRGLWHAHLGWLFTDRGEPASRRAADLEADRDLVVMNALFPLWCIASLALPFALGWFLGGTIGAAFSALLWAGLVRIFLLHHVTWSVNSLCHAFGRRPFATSDQSRNIAALSLLSMGESWHNGHHAFPRSARHGLLPGQWDSAAMLIHAFERLGWADDIHQPSRDAIQARRAVRESSGLGSR